MIHTQTHVQVKSKWGGEVGMWIFPIKASPHFPQHTQRLGRGLSPHPGPLEQPWSPHQCEVFLKGVTAWGSVEMKGNCTHSWKCLSLSSTWNTILSSKTLCKGAAGIMKIVDSRGKWTHPSKKPILFVLEPACQLFIQQHLLQVPHGQGGAFWPWEHTCRAQRREAVFTGELRRTGGEKVLQKVWKQSAHFYLSGWWSDASACTWLTQYFIKAFH